MTFTSQIPSIPGFSAEQVSSLTKLMEEMLDRAFGRLDKSLDKCFKPQLSQQAKDSLESTTKKRRKKKKKSTVSSSSPVNMSLLSTVPRPRNMSILRELSSCLSTARIQHAPNLAPLSASQHAHFLASRFASPLGYIRDAEEMEATGQG